MNLITTNNIKHQTRPLIAQDSSILYTIANKNAHSIGHAAFMSRNLLGLCIVDNFVSNGSIIRQANNNDEITTNSDINIFPNPADDILYIEFSNKTDHIYTLSIFDVLGKEILHKYINTSSKSSIDIRGLQAGMYFFSISTNNQTLEKGKFIKR